MYKLLSISIVLLLSSISLADETVIYNKGFIRRIWKYPDTRVNLTSIEVVSIDKLVTIVIQGDVDTIEKELNNDKRFIRLKLAPFELQTKGIK